MRLHEGLKKNEPLPSWEIPPVIYVLRKKYDCFSFEIVKMHRLLLTAPGFGVLLSVVYWIFANKEVNENKGAGYPG